MNMQTLDTLFIPSVVFNNYNIFNKNIYRTEDKSVNIYQ